MNQSSNARPSLTKDETEAFEERAAIMQFDGKLPKIQAEKLAMDDIIKQRQQKRTAPSA